MKAKLVTIAILALAISGCAIMNKAGNFNSDGMPKRQFDIGGGLILDYIALQPGILYVIDENSKKFLMNKTLKQGESYDQDFDLSDERTKTKLKENGIDPENIDLRFYFIPSRTPKTLTPTEK